MDIYGIQKLTMLDYPGKTAATVFLGGCNFRCPYCHNSELINLKESKIEPVMTGEELILFLKKRKGLLEGVCVSGGEPLLHPEVESLIREIKNLDYPVKLDTNGSNPQLLKKLCREELIDYVAMDIKGDEEGYLQACGIDPMGTDPSQPLENRQVPMGTDPTTEEGQTPSPNGDPAWQPTGTDPPLLGTDPSLLSRIKECAAFLIAGGALDYEFRTTTLAQLHNKDTFINIGKWLKGAKKYYIQPFRDRDTVIYSGLSAPGREELFAYRDILLKTMEIVEIRGI